MQNDPLRLHFNNAIPHLAVDGGPVSMRQYICLPGNLTITGLQRHALFVNKGEAATITYATNQEGQETFTAEPDSIICILPANKTAQLKWTQNITLCVYLLDCDYVARLHGSIPDFTPRWDLSDPLIREACSRLFSAMTVVHFPERTYAESLIILCIDALSRNSRSIPDDHPGKGKLSPKQLQHVIAFAHDSMQFDIGLVDLANRVHLSAYHFGRLFKQTVGLSPYQYLLQMRIEYAKKLILEKAGPLGEIAYQLNFSDQAHFSNAFRKATGVSPRQYQHGQPALL